MTQRTTIAMIEAMVKRIRDRTSLPIDYTLAYGDQYQLYLGSGGSIDRTIGRVAIGRGNFFDMLKGIDDVLAILEQKANSMDTQAEVMQ
jgi:hypothetical protein